MSEFPRRKRDCAGSAKQTATANAVPADDEATDGSISGSAFDATLAIEFDPGTGVPTVSTVRAHREALLSSCSASVCLAVLVMLGDDGDNATTLDALLRKGASADVRVSGGNSLLHCAAQAGTSSILLRLLQNVSDPSTVCAKNDFGFTALDVARCCVNASERLKMEGLLSSPFSPFSLCSTSSASSPFSLSSASSTSSTCSTSSASSASSAFSLSSLSSACSTSSASSASSTSSLSSTYSTSSAFSPAITHPVPTVQDAQPTFLPHTGNKCGCDRDLDALYWPHVSVFEDDVARIRGFVVEWSFDCKEE